MIDLSHCFNQSKVLVKVYKIMQLAIKSSDYFINLNQTDSLPIKMLMTRVQIALSIKQAATRRLQPAESLKRDSNP